MADSPQRSEHLFIVRIWQEASQTLAGPWRGSVEHVPSAQRLYFASLNDLTDFIALRVNGSLQAEKSTDESPAAK